jgi:hypothetical protein
LKSFSISTVAVVGYTSLDTLNVSLRHPPLAGDAFVDEGFAVGEEGLYLPFDTGFNCHAAALRISRFHWQGYQVSLC